MHFKLRISLKSYKIGGEISVRALSPACTYAMLACVILPSCDQFLGIPSHNDYHLVLHTGKTLMRDVTACIVSQKTDGWIKSGWVILARIRGHSINTWTKFCPLLTTFLPLTILTWTFFTLSLQR